MCEICSVDPTGEFSRQRQHLLCLERNRSAEDIIMAEIKHVRQVVQAKYEKLRFASDVQAGVEILHLFVLDLLGRDTPVAKIFLTKSEQDFRHSMVVSRWIKSIAWAAVVIINLFFVYFSVLRGLERGQKWQNMFLMACIVQILIEIVFYETTECVIVHFVIPSLARKEVQTASVMLQQAVQRICSNRLDRDSLFLDAPRYLFVSTNLAQRFPDLLESVIVESYHSYHPGQLSHKWHISHSGYGPSILRSSWARSLERIRRLTVTALLVSIMQRIGALNPTIQRVIIHTLQPIFASIIFLIFYMLVRNPLYFIFLAPYPIYLARKFLLQLKRYKPQQKQNAELNQIFPSSRVESNSLENASGGNDSCNDMHVPEHAAQASIQLLDSACKTEGETVDELYSHGSSVAPSIPVAAATIASANSVLSASSVTDANAAAAELPVLLNTESHDTNIISCDIDYGAGLNSADQFYEGAAGLGAGVNVSPTHASPLLSHKIIWQDSDSDRQEMECNRRRIASYVLSSDEDDAYSNMETEVDYGTHMTRPAARNLFELSSDELSTE